MSVERTESAPGDHEGRAGTRSDALLLATTATEDGGPAALLPIGEATALRTLMAQLVSLGVERVWIVADPDWQQGIEAEARGTGAEVEVVPTGEISESLGTTAELAAAGSGPFVIATASLVAHREALASVLADELSGSTALVARGGRLVGIAKISGSDRTGLARAAEELAELVRTEPEQAQNDSMLDSACPFPLLVVGLIRTVTGLRALDVGRYVAATPRSRDEAQMVAARLAAVDENQARLEAAVKTYDGFFSTFCVNPYSKHLARLAARLGLSPNVVTVASLATGIAAAASFALGSRSGLVAGAVLLIASFYLDGVDGTLARYTQRFSAFGAWLDSVCDRGKEHLVYAGLAVGSVRGFDDDVWLLAACALALQLVRHVGDAAYVAARRSREAHPTPERTSREGFANTLRGPVLKWAHRIIRFPVGERLLLISLTAAITTPRTTFVALLAWGGFAGVYTVVGRVVHDHPATRRAVRAALR
jgi:phosphatidylglycerophosphate synthase